MIITSTKKFNKDFKKLDSNIQKKFFVRVEIFKTNKQNSILKNHKLNGIWKNHRSINITADIRALYKQTKAAVIFVAIGSHSDLYE